MNMHKLPGCLTVMLLGAALCSPTMAQEKEASKKGASAGQPSESEMMAMMMELAKPSENHKLLAQGVGTWTYKVKMWMSPDTNAPPSESSGNTVTREAMGGRYFISDHASKMQMPGLDGKMMDLEFKGMAVEAYDNVKRKFLASWIDNMGTGILMLEGTYDAATSTFTYRGEVEMMPGMKTKVREVIHIQDTNHRTFEWYEDRGGSDVKTMEINYTRNR